MITDINYYLAISPTKKGGFKIIQTVMQQSNLYDLLHQIGYSLGKVGGKRQFFQRIDLTVIPCELFHVKNAFVDFIKAGGFTNLPNRLKVKDILNWYYENNPIKDNCLFADCLKDSLRDEDELILRQKADPVFARRCEIEQLLKKLQEWSFKKAIDIYGNFSKGSYIYYKNVGNNKFLVFNHFKSQSGTVEGFDSWLANFNSEQQISAGRASFVESVTMGFHINKHFGLISQYVD